MPKVSLTSKMVREPEDGSKKEDNTEKRKKKDVNSDTVEFESCVQTFKSGSGGIRILKFSKHPRDTQNGTLPTCCMGCRYNDS